MGNGDQMGMTLQEADRSKRHTDVFSIVRYVKLFVGQTGVDALGV